MDRWTEDEFERAARTTRLTKRTLDACMDVLVHGMSGAEAAVKHQMFHAQISRSLTNLRDKHAELGFLPQSKDDLLKHVAQEIAKGVLGPGFNIAAAEPGKTYSGPVVVNTNGFIVQKVGRSGVLHDKSNFEVVPEQGDQVDIAYADGQKKAVVQKAVEPDKGRGVER